jgi:hypothetical protein
MHDKEVLVMTGSRGERLASAAGSAFAGLLAAAIVLIVSGSPDDKATNRQIAVFYEGHGGRLQLAAFLLGLGGLCLLAFVGALRNVFREADHERGGLSGVTLGAGLISVGLVFVLGSSVAAVGTAADWFDSYKVNADVARTMEMVTYWVGTYAGMAAGVLVGVSSIAALRTKALPRWLAFLGFPIALVGLAGIINWGLGLPVTGVWVLLTSVVLTARGAPGVRRVTAPTPA